MSGMEAKRAAALHGPKPNDGVDQARGKRSNRHEQTERGVPQESVAGRMAAAFGFQPEVGICFRDSAEPEEICEITRLFADGSMEVAQTSAKNGRNYIVTRRWLVPALENILAQHGQGKREWTFSELNSDEGAESGQSSQAGTTVPADSLEGDMTWPSEGSVRGVEDGGTNGEADTANKMEVSADNADTAAIDDQEPILWRRRGGAKHAQKNKAPTRSGAVTNTNDGNQSVDAEAELNAEETLAESDAYREGAVWVEQYLEESERQAAAQVTPYSEAAPSGVTTDNTSLETGTPKAAESAPQESPSLGDLENAVMAPLGSPEEQAILEALDPLSLEETPDSPSGRETALRHHIEVATAACNQARLEYVTADNESRTVMSRLRGVLGISGKGIQNDVVAQKKESYQSTLRALRDLRLEMVKMRHMDRMTESDSHADAPSPGGNPEGGPSQEAILKSFPDSEEKHPLEQELEAELLHFAQEVNIGLYNAWTELKSEQKGFLGRVKQFGTAYNQLSWKKKLLIGIPVAALSVASGAGLLGSAMASAAVAAVLARRGVAAAGLFAAADGGLQKVAEKRAEKMAQKILAQGQTEMASLQALDYQEADAIDTARSEPGDAVTVRSEASSPEEVSPETTPESLDDKLERMKTFLDNHVIDSLDQTLEKRVRGQDRRRLGALAGSMGVAFGLPSFLASDQGGSGVLKAIFGDDYFPPSGAPASAPRFLPGVGGGSAEVSQVTLPKAEASLPSISATAGSAEVGAAANPFTAILESEVSVAKGDSVWKLIDANLAAKTDLAGAKKTYFIDFLKDRYLEQGGQATLIAGKTFDWSALSEKDVEAALKAAKALTPDQENSILNGTQAATEAATPSGGALTEGSNLRIDEATRKVAQASVESSQPSSMADTGGAVNTSEDSLTTGSENDFSTMPVPYEIPSPLSPELAVQFARVENITERLPEGMRLSAFLQAYAFAKESVTPFVSNPRLLGSNVSLAEAQAVLLVLAEQGGGPSKVLFSAHPEITLTDFVKATKAMASAPKTSI
jgi:hypothetical protein